MTSVEDYDYELPEDLIAQHPLATRSDARLLIVDRVHDCLEQAHVRDLPEILRPGDLLVLNDSRVIPARLVGFRTKTGGKWHGLFLAAEGATWRILGSTRGKLQVGETLTLLDRNAQPHTKLHLLSRLNGGQWAVRAETDEPATHLLNRIGRVPLPHYIRDGIMVDDDLQDYQTVYSATPGSIAAPTAGLHFTQELLQQLDDDGVSIASVTLHVGIGTFRPISSETLQDHQMHSEWAEVSSATAKTINETRQAGGRVICVGTTSMRTLESAAAAERSSNVTTWQGETDLFIRPSYEFQIADGLMTNFHLPKSTLLVLVRTFGGDALIRRAYDLAVAEQYRFFSYGDAMLIL